MFFQIIQRIEDESFGPTALSAVSHTVDELFVLNERT
jgi:hypothetical protein